MLAGRAVEQSITDPLLSPSFVCAAAFSLTKPVFLISDELSAVPQMASVGGKGPSAHAHSSLWCPVPTTAKLALQIPLPASPSWPFSSESTRVCLGLQEGCPGIWGALGGGGGAKEMPGGHKEQGWRDAGGRCSRRCLWGVVQRDGGGGMPGGMKGEGGVWMQAECPELSARGVAGGLNDCSEVYRGYSGMHEELAEGVQGMRGFVGGGVQGLPGQQS